MSNKNPDYTEQYITRRESVSMLRVFERFIDGTNYGKQVIVISENGETCIDCESIIEDGTCLCGLTRTPENINNESENDSR